MKDKIKLHDPMKSKKEIDQSVPSPMRPTLYLDEDQLPELKDFEVGDEVTLKVLTKIKGLSENVTNKGKKTCRYEVEVQKLGVDDMAEMNQEEQDNFVREKYKE